MSAELAVQLGLVVFLSGTTAILLSSVRSRKRRQRMATLATLHGMRRADEKQLFAARPMASIRTGRSLEFKLQDLLVGSDEHGRFFFVGRRYDLYRDHLLCFESPEPTRVSNFHFCPDQALPWSWRSLLPFGNKPATDTQHRLEWTAKSSRWSDTASLGMGARVVGHAARLSAEPLSEPLGVEIHDSKILIHSAGPLGGDRLHRFLGSALQLRRAILNAQRHAHSRAAEAKISRGWESADTEDVQVQVVRS